MEAARSSETSVSYHNVRLQNPEDRDVNLRRLKEFDISFSSARTRVLTHTFGMSCVIISVSGLLFALHLITPEKIRNDFRERGLARIFTAEGGNVAPKL
jgi:hypothetical protein